MIMSVPVTEGCEWLNSLKLRCSKGHTCHVLFRNEVLGVSETRTKTTNKRSQKSLSERGGTSLRHYSHSCIGRLQHVEERGYQKKTLKIQRKINKDKTQRIRIIGKQWGFWLAWVQVPTEVILFMQQPPNWCCSFHDLSLLVHPNHNYKKSFPKCCFYCASSRNTVLTFHGSCNEVQILRHNIQDRSNGCWLIGWYWPQDDSGPCIETVRCCHDCIWIWFLSSNVLLEIKKGDLLQQRLQRNSYGKLNSLAIAW